ncbi:MULTISPECIES: hypothetical protein [Yersinia]|uniref:hypothetical protein n=1 Tax=Yersinia TaxID=629 RepID=UPI0009B70433|nr:MULTISPECIES: hypothetical protein [Yersinia]ARB83919.1 hypothetical protein A6J67_07685 [Yersinia sp. FDAARGOS_228]AVL37714.1 hypothetical protein CEQ36_20465 [Yersinia intermedia]
MNKIKIQFFSENDDIDETDFSQSKNNYDDELFREYREFLFRDANNNIYRRKIKIPIVSLIQENTIVNFVEKDNYVILSFNNEYPKENDIINEPDSHYRKSGNIRRLLSPGENNGRLCDIDLPLENLKDQYKSYIRVSLTTQGDSEGLV